MIVSWQWGGSRYSSSLWLTSATAPGILAELRINCKEVVVIYNEDPKRFFLNLAHQPGGFTIEEVHRSLDDGTIPRLPSGLLWELWDVGLKFGHWTSGGLLFKSAGLLGPSEASISLMLHQACAWDHRGGIVVTGWAGEAIRLSRAVLIVLRNGVPLLWERGLNAGLVRVELERIDAKAKGLGLINADGERRFVPTPHRLN